MGFWQKIKSMFTTRQSSTDKGKSASSAHRPIAFSPMLISNLQTDHQLLLSQFRQVQLLVETGEYTKGFQELQTFRSTLLGHLHLENLKLYVYLQTSLPAHSNEYVRMRLFRKEMDAISKVAIGFFTKYSEPPTHLNEQDFLKEWQALGKVLINRIQREENQLYTLYKDW